MRSRISPPRDGDGQVSVFRRAKFHSSQLVYVVLILSFFFLIPSQSATGKSHSSDFTGVWLGTVPLNGLPRTLAIQLDERADGRLLGYVLGGTGTWTVVSGSADGNVISLTLELKTLAAVTPVVIVGKLRGKGKEKGENDNDHDGDRDGKGRGDGDRGDRGSDDRNRSGDGDRQRDEDRDGNDIIVGQLSDGAAVRFERTNGPLYERRFLVASLGPNGEPNAANDIAVVVERSGRFVTGAFAGRDNCGLWGCDGTITSFSDTTSFSRMRGNLEFRFSAAGGCSGLARLQPYDATLKYYAGDQSCPGMPTSTIFGGRTTRTRNSDVAQILSRMGELADDLEGGVPLFPPHPAFSPDYLDSGWRLVDLLASYSAEIAHYQQIAATFNRFTLIHTMPDPDGLMLEETPVVGAVFDEMRSGIPFGSASRITYVDTHATPTHSRLREWIDEGGLWVAHGNQIPPVDFPFAYTIVTDAGSGAPRVGVPTNGGASSVYLSIGPFGSHFAPLTGHAYGDAKANLVGFFTSSDSDLDSVNHAYYGGAGGSLLIERRPLYVAPVDGSIDSVECVASMPGLYLNGEPLWVVGVSLSTGHFLRLDHVGKIHESLQAKIQAATGRSTNVCLSPGGGNILGTVQIPVAEGEPLAFPQIVAHELPAAPGYFRGGGGFADRPWAQMEFTISIPGILCYYDVLPPATKPGLQAVLDADMANVLSQRFHSFQATKWQWGAEGRLCMAPSNLPDGYSELYTNLGGWFEKDEPGGIVSNEIVSFAPIATDVATYNPALYSPGVEMLILRKNAFLSSAFFPIGEILERSADTLLIRWRIGVSLAFPFQRATYTLDASGLKIHWGTFSMDPAGAAAPTPASGLPCNGATVVCYDHTYHTGY